MLLSGLSLASACLSFVLCGVVLGLSLHSTLNRVVALALFAYALWALGASFVFSAPDANTFWTSLRWALLAYLTYHPTGMAITVVLAGLRGWKVWAFVVPAIVFALVEAFQLFTGPWLFTAYHSTPWGTVGGLHPDPFWPTLESLSNNLWQLVALAVLIWAWFKNPSRRYRSILVQLVVVSLLIFIVGTFCILVVWMQWGYPEPTVILGVFYGLNWIVLIWRYDHLRDEPTQPPVSQFPHLQESLVLANPSGIILQASAGMLNLLGKKEDEICGRLIFEAFEGWTGLEAAWEKLRSTGEIQPDLTGLVGTGNFTMSVTAFHNRFHEPTGVLVSVRPQSNLDVAVGRYRLSARERATAELLLQGLGTQEIAETLFISQATVRNHLHNLFQKTGSASRSDLVRLLVRETPTLL